MEGQTIRIAAYIVGKVETTGTGRPDHDVMVDAVASQPVAIVTCGEADRAYRLSSAWSACRLVKRNAPSSGQVPELKLPAAGNKNPCRTFFGFVHNSRLVQNVRRENSLR